MQRIARCAFISKLSHLNGSAKMLTCLDHVLIGFTELIGASVIARQHVAGDIKILKMAQRICFVPRTARLTCWVVDNSLSTGAIIRLDSKNYRL